MRFEKTSAGMLTSDAPLSTMKFKLMALLMTTGAIRPPDIFRRAIRVSPALPLPPSTAKPNSVLSSRTAFALIFVRPGLSRSALRTSSRAILVLFALA
jgi:hypothetical protein